MSRGQQIIGVSLLTLGLTVVACGSDLEPGDVALGTPIAAPVIGGKADGVQHEADHACRVVLRETKPNYPLDSDGNVQCGRFGCYVIVAFDVADDAISKGAEARLAFSRDKLSWYTTDALRPSSGKAPAGFTRFVTPVRASTHLTLIPYIQTKQGASVIRSYDHNVTQGDYVLDKHNRFEIQKDAKLGAKLLGACGAGAAVKLIRSESWTHTRYSMQSYEKSFLIKLRNITFHKKVSIHFEKSDGSWGDIAATYKSAAGDDELWAARYSGKDFAGRFNVRYEAAGESYVDDNGGKNYSIGNNDGVWVGEGINVQLSAAYLSASSFRGVVDLRNIAPSKRVEIQYTTDDWRSRQTVQASYLGSYRNYGYAGTRNPNANGIEGWSFSARAPQGSNSIRFRIVYSVNGRTYVDDNYGKQHSVALK